jgi:VCBS repeat-containing protein
MLPAVGHASFRIVTADVTEVITQDVTPEIAQTLHLSHPEGVVVTELTYSPLRQGDVILSINGKPVDCQAQLNWQLANLPPGVPFTLEILRDGQIQTVTVQLATECLACAAFCEAAPSIRGIHVATLSTQNAVVVTDVQIGTPAANAGLKTGDIILDVNGQQVHTASEFQEDVQQLSNQDASFNVRQTDGRLNVFVIPY